MTRIKHLLSKEGISSELIKFGLAGAANNLIIIFLYEILLFFIDYKMASLLTYFLGFFLVFYTNTAFVFRTGKTNFMQKIKCIVIYIANCGVFYIALVILKEDFQLSPRISVFFIVFFLASFNFILSRRILRN